MLNDENVVRKANAAIDNFIQDCERIGIPPLVMKMRLMELCKKWFACGEWLGYPENTPEEKKLYFVEYDYYGNCYDACYFDKESQSFLIFNSDTFIQNVKRFSEINGLESLSC